jgi:site-specific DNA-methyltransferase (adenine-specific)
VKLIEEIINTYSNIGAIVLDNTAGSGSTGEASGNTGRDCILIENDPYFINVIEARLGLISI